MNKLELLYDIGLFIRDNKEKLLENPNSFSKTLELLRKAKNEFERKGFSVVDDPNENIEEDDAEKWLKENAPTQPPTQPPAEAPAKKYLSEWKPRSYNDKEKASIQKLMAEGFSHREAEQAISETPNFKDALRSGIAPHMPSEKRMALLKPLAKLLHEKKYFHELKTADPETNTVKRHIGKMLEAHQNWSAKYDKDLNEFLNSDEVKNVKGLKRHKILQDWKNKWHTDNPEHLSNVQEASDAQKQVAYNQKKAKDDMKEIGQHIARGGAAAMPTDMSEQEAMQHLGGGKDEEGGYQGSTVQDPAVAFAAKNPKLVAALTPEQHDRMKRVDSAAAAQGVVRRRKKE